MVYNNEQLLPNGVTCVVSLDFSIILNTFISSAYPARVKAISCGRKKKDRKCTDGSNNDNHRAGRAIDTEIYVDGRRVLPKTCDPSKISAEELEIVHLARRAGLKWGGDFKPLSVGRNECNHFQQESISYPASKKKIYRGCS